MKRFAAPAIVVCVALSVATGRAQDIKLTGIISVPTLKCALLEVPAKNPLLRVHILSEGDNAEGLSVKRIDAASGRVEVEYGGATRLLRLNSTKAGPDDIDATNTLQSAVSLRSADFRSVSSIYGRLKGRTILVHPELRVREFSTTAAATNASEVADALEKMFRQYELATIPDGTNFIMLVPNTLTNSVHPRSGEMHPGEAAEIIEVGQMNFPRTDAFVVLRIYQMLTGRTFVYNQHMEGNTSIIDSPVSGEIYFVNTSSLSKNEAIYALETLFDWNGIKIIPIDDKSFKVEIVPYLKRPH